MTVEELFEKVKDDLNIDKKDLSLVSLNIPNLFSKYSALLFVFQKHLAECKADLDKMYATLYVYYKKDHPIIFKNKQEIDAMIYGDERYIEIKRKYDELSNIVQFLENTIKQIHQLPFTIRNVIEWEKFKHGS